MKKTLLISGGILLILIAIGVWAYLFIMGTPKEGEGIFSNFGFGNNDVPVITDGNPSIVDTSSVTQSGNTQRLRQLTARPVAGATFIQGGIRYAEKGTGHIYDIMFSTGNESAFSSVTTPRIVEAVFSPDGNRVALTSENNDGLDVYVSTITRDDQGTVKLDGAALPTNIREVSFSDTGESVYYLEETSAGATGRSYNFARKVTETLFSIPLRDTQVLWRDPVYVYTTPTAEQAGYLYKLTGSTMSFTVLGEKGLMAIPYEEGLVLSTSVEEGLLSTAYEKGYAYTMPIGMFPDKCVDDPKATSTLYCAAPLEFESLSAAYPDDWYKGIVSFVDALWKIDVTKSEAVLVSDLLAESGRAIDVMEMGASEHGDYLYFINKNDDTLWMYDLTL